MDETTPEVMIGAWLRSLREGLHVSQEQVAGWMWQAGHGWDRSTMTRVELGQRSLTAVELFALLHYLAQHQEIADGLLGGDTGPPIPRSVSIDDIPGLAEALSPSGRGMAAIRRDLEAERRTARLLGVDLDELQAMSQAAWGCSFTEAREARATSRMDGDQSLRLRRALATKALVADLQERGAEG